jgi:DNA-binding CsgD family transcriptional regulator
MTEQTVLDLVGLIYDASMAPSLWPAFLEKFAESVRGTITSLIHYDSSSPNGSFASGVRVDPAELRKYNEYFVSKDDWAKGAISLALPQGKVFFGEEVCPAPVFTQGEFYNDFLKPMNAFHQFGGIVLRDGTTYSVISSLRSRAAGAFGEDEGRMLGRLVPHLQRALQMHRKIVGLETRTQAVAEALDRFPQGVVLVNERGKALFVNREAKAILDQNDGLTLTREGLLAARPGETVSLRKLIQGASLTSEGNGLDSGGVMTISRPSSRRPLSILVTPLASNGFELGQNRPAAAIFINDPEREHEPEHKILGRLFDLTPAESRVAALLMQGKSIEEASGELAISLHTARTHLKRILEKTGTSRQGELIRLLLSSPAVLRPPE